jgi:two-component system chemotaxis response regulator CheB
MKLMKVGGRYQVSIRPAPKVNGHCPSVEVLFDSVAKAAKDRAVGIILTGMGGDGAKGLLAMREAGARTIGQDESTCVVYGMPRVAYELGAVEYQEKLGDIAGRTCQLLNSL